MEKSYDLFKKKLQSLQSTIIQQLSVCRDSYYREDVADKLAQTRTLQSIAIQLKDLCLDESPIWLIQIMQACDRILADQGNFQYKRDFGTNIAQYITNVSMHDWALGGYNNDFDFESIYARYKSESKLDMLFAELVALIEKIINENGIDVIEAEKGLKQLLTVVKTNMNKSMFADEAIVSYLFFFIKEFMLNMASRIPGLREFIDALFTTTKKISEEMASLRSKTQEEVEKRTKIGNIALYDNAGRIKELDDIYSRAIEKNA